MSHLVKPISFRVGKTQVWPHNTLLNTKNELVNSNLTLASSIARVSKSLLRRKRIYAVRGSINNFINGKLIYNLIFMPRIKTKPRRHSIGAFIRKTIYKPFNFLQNNTAAKIYVNARKDKVAKIRKRFRPKRLNRWLTKRMFRGSNKIIWRKAKIAYLAKIPVYRYLTHDNMSLLPHTDICIQQPLNIFKKATKFLHKRCNGSLARKKKWCRDRLSARRFNDKKFSYVLSRTLNRSVIIKSINLFSYLISKRVVVFKNHQNHFWNFRYRRYRFQYKNYFDIINAFFSIGIVEHSENFLFSILKITLPLILKIRKFFKFLNTVIMHMPEIQEKFYVFKISITGKLAGGTKRTKFHSIGYGVLPVQTLSTLATNNFIAYTHIYGEFGLKLIMAKNAKYLSPKMFI